MRCVMRCFRVALNFAAFVVPAVATIFVCSDPASAHSYRHHGYSFAHSHRIHYASQRVVVMQPNLFASAGGFAYPNYYSGFATSQTYPSYAAGQTGYAQGTGYAQYGGWDRRNSDDNVSAMSASQAGAAGLPASLVERVIRRESGGNPRAVHAGNYGLMQIRLSTARAMGYTGSAAGLLDAQTNMTYALRYLAGAYRAAGGNESRAVALYSRGYYNQAKGQGFSPYASMSRGG
jgi:soluble lytic murein transglycosylase-like protein